MAIRGFSIDITDKVNRNQAITFAQWIGASNVMRNQKLTEYKNEDLVSLHVREEASLLLQDVCQKQARCLTLT